MAKSLIMYLTVFISVMIVSCGGSSGSGTKSSMDDSYPSDVDFIKERAVAAANLFISEEFDKSSKFQKAETIVRDTEVPNRFKVVQKFSADRYPDTELAYRIWVQEFKSGWEYGLMEVETLGGKKVFVSNGKMKKMEQMDGVGDELTVAGIKFLIAEKKPTAIRIYTQKRLNQAQLKEVIKSLMDTYSTIQFATADKHQRGDEYASWTGDMFFDYDKNIILSKKKYFK